MNPLVLAWRQLRRDFASGDVRILFVALVLAVVAITSVGFVTDRAGRALAQEANRLLGGDAVVRSDSPITGAVRTAANAPGLQHADTLDMRSMVRVGEQLQLGELRAIDGSFPLRGTFRIVDRIGGPERDARGGPASGNAWMSVAGAQTLDAKVGDTLSVGDARFTLVALVAQEPDAAFDYFNTAPRVMINLADVPRTGLVQEGSRVGYRLIIAGDAPAVARFLDTARTQRGRGQRIETIEDARPEMRSALDRAGRFLGLAALVSVILASIAVAMAARRHSARHLDGSAVMRCLGAQQRTLVVVHLGELLWLGLIACTVGVAVSFALQWAIGEWLARALAISIPAAGWLPALQGYAVGLVVLIAFGAPPVLALRRVPALRVLRRDLDPTEPSAWMVGVAAFAGLAALLWWKAESPALATAMLGGVAGTLLVLAALAWAMILGVRKVRTRLRGSLRYGLANVGRRAGTAVAQVSALGLGLMALLLLTFVRTDLLDRWQLSLAENAPNRFVINVQDDQVAPVRRFVESQGLASPTLYPMVRARLLERNGKAVSAKDYPDDQRMQRRAEREFNLSFGSALRDDNRLSAGTFWGDRKPASPEISVEQKFADSLGWKLGDRITFDIAGQPLAATITSFREVSWDSFRPNFFVLVSPGALDGYPASWITAVSVPKSQPRFTAKLVERFPNLSVIDVEATLAQVRATADQVSVVVQVVFWFSLAAGILVLLAAISASQDERLLEGGVMRVLGGSRRQLRFAQASEFAAIGLLSGLVAAIAASVLAGVVSVRVFGLPWEPNWALAAAGGGIGLLAALVTGLVATRRVVDVPPSVVLRELQQ
ncbi:putative ABC transporter, permease protein [Lysobacter dokdonensis DS-58]|uniref:Putative ABC transporter, permease protein n=1 Tax=Lysobacter dokdonensis DS-58 TaxID=1300345 RepID=A0A0A2X333_9GAMM|nr:FtsX-like permease family protein [Lysobacter dokdonensis]KGQ19614.1 putative ABC transporter, permease protein [Lysobacter dokdonensis DS-58]